MKRRKGFTFIELILAILLFSFGIISVMQVFPLNRRLLSQSAMQTQASFLAQEQMERVRTRSYSELTVGQYEPRAFLPGTMGAFAAQFERNTVVTLIDGNHQVSFTDVGLKRITVTVYWTERNVNRTYVLTSYENNL
jgi:prepilin-type N-terminal cleavage/methylation domain-containing protein